MEATLNDIKASPKIQEARAIAALDVTGLTAGNLTGSFPAIDAKRRALDVTGNVSNEERGTQGKKRAMPSEPVIHTNVRKSEVKETTRVPLETLPVYQLTIGKEGQGRLAHLINILLDTPYSKHGKIEGSEDSYNLIIPSSFGSDRRKPVSQDFQNWGDTICWPIFSTLLFGEKGDHVINRYMYTVKINTIVYGQNSDYYGQGKYHMHLDNKPSPFQEKNIDQIRRQRLIFSIVKDAIDDPSFSLEEYRLKYGCTVYLKDQPEGGFTRQKDFYTYMQERYTDWGTENGKERPLYDIPDEDLVRALPGDVMIHYSHDKVHGAHPIHAEANPCPSGRCLFAIDIQDIVVNKKSQRIPTEEIIRYMEPLKTTGEEFEARCNETISVIERLKEVYKATLTTEEALMMEEATRLLR